MLYPANKGPSNMTMPAWNDSENDAIIIMQYAGHKTKAGEMIFENDIIDCSFRGKGIVKFKASSFMLVSNHFWQYIGRLVEPVIVGNIFENPELIPEDMKSPDGSLSDSWKHPWVIRSGKKKPI